MMQFRAFPLLAEAEGFVVAGRESSNTYNDSSILALTGNSSYVLIGKDSLRHSGNGATLAYKRLPLREETTIQDMALDGGAFLKGIPQTDEVLSVKNKGGQNILQTSPLIAVYRRPYPSDAVVMSQRVHRSMTIAKTMINRSSGLGKK